MPGFRTLFTRGVLAACLFCAACGGTSHKHSSALRATTTTVAPLTPATAAGSSTSTTQAAARTPSTTVTKHTSTTIRTSPPPRKTDIDITKAGYSPSSFTVAHGTIVNVTNDDTVAHTITADNGSFDTGPIQPRVSNPFIAPAKPGTYAFHDSSGSFRGSLVVT
jgi:plastocyanin